ncbi:XRE family transcriptional regulator [uncultured Ruminococcus sp.]|uniref:helix-turn-helix domain-containing protein n=1 Tax=Ruminococcus callidus TaxID=40519 RepID=UPI00266C8E0A|nr:XRE family transcriptional regulator [uncultured Ruminococcus sp.]
MSIGSRIKEKRESIGMTQEELAAELGVSKGAIGNYESGNSYPKIDNMIQLFKALKTDANYIFQDETVQKEVTLSSKEQTVIKKYRKLDNYGIDAVDGVLDVEYIRCTNPAPSQSQPHTWTICYSEYKASAGTGVMLDSYERMERLDVLDTPAARRADYGLMISGNSMEPTYHDGDIVLVEQADSVEVGEIGIFVVDGDGYIKKFGGDCLISLNDDYAPIPLHEYNHVKCCGKVIGVAQVAE